MQMLRVFMTLSMAFPAFADSVSTSVDLNSRVTQMWRAKHPFKWFKCWGKPDEIKVWQADLESDSSENSGSLGATYHNEDGKAFDAFTPQTADWRAILGADRTFTVTFSQDVTPEQTNYQKSTCTTNEYYSRLDAVSNDFESNARIVIPKDVYLVRIRELKRVVNQKTVNQFESFVEHAQRVEEDGIQRGDLQIDLGKQQYLLVKPGSHFDLSVKWHSESIEDADFEIAYEIKLIGQELCSENLWDPQTTTGRNIIPHVQKLFSSERLDSNPDEVIAGLACLRSPGYINSFLKENHGQDLVKFLGALSDSLADFSRQEKVTDKYYREIWLTTQMAILDLSRNLLRDMNKFCDTRTVLELFENKPPQTVEIRGYHYAARQYYRIGLLFKQAPVGLLQDVAHILETESGVGTTYAQMATPEIIDTLEQIQYMIFQAPFRTYGLIRKQLAEMPKLSYADPNQAAIEFALDRGDQIFKELNIEYINQMHWLGNKKLQVIDARKLVQLVSQHASQVAELESLMQDNIDWFKLFEFDGNVSHTQFTEDMFTLNHDLMKISGELLEKFYGTKIGNLSDKNFVGITGLRKLYGEVDQCLMESHD